MNFIFACGGTAGHINPALAIAWQLKKAIPDANILFIGAGRDMENRLVPSAGYELINVKMSGLRRGFKPKDIIHNLLTAAKLVAAGLKIKRIIRSFKPNAAIGTGGYICYPVLRKAAKMGIPTIVHESNAEPGLTTRMLSGIVDRLLVSFPDLESRYKKPERVVFTGTPVRWEPLAKGDENKQRTSDQKPLVLSFWGSLGAERMNEMMAEFISINLSTESFRHIHAAGMLSGVVEMNENLRKIGVADELPEWISICEYIDNMQSVMADADLVLCRAGGSTVAELISMRKPAVLIPSPYVSNNEQFNNAVEVCKAGGALMVEEKDCTGKLLYETVVSLLSDKEQRDSMAIAHETLDVPNAAQRIAELIISMVGGGAA